MAGCISGDITMAEKSIWLYRIKNAAGEVILNLTDAYDRDLKLALNKAGEASFKHGMKSLYDSASKININMSQIFAEGINTLECLRNGTLIFAGQIEDTRSTLSHTDDEVQVKALGWLNLLKKRHAGFTTERVFTATDSGEIFWTVINEAQQDTNGDFGITQGNIDISIPRTISYVRKPILEIGDELSGADNGFDYEITPLKVLNIYYPAKYTDKTQTCIFKYGTDNFGKIERIRSATDLYNSSLVIGKGWGTQELSATRDDVTSQGVFKIREKIDSFKDMNNATVLGDISQQIIDVLGNVVPYYLLSVRGNDVSPSFDSYDVGDFIRVIVDRDFWNMDQSLRVFEKFIKIGNNDLEDITLTVGLI